MDDYINELVEFNYEFEKKYLNSYGYNFNYNDVMKKNLGKNITLVNIANNFFDLFERELEQYFKSKYKGNFEFLKLNNEQKSEVINVAKKVNNCNINGDWKNDFFNIVKEELKIYVKFIKNNISTNKIKLETVFSNSSKYPTLNDLIGLDNAKKVIKERILEPTKYKDVYEKYDIKVGGGILLYGLPGTGKTMFAQAVANEVNAKFFSIKSSDIKSKYFGETENKIRNIFENARRYPVSIIFFDEFEAIGVSRDKYGAELTANSVVPELLSQMQGFEKNNNIILVIAATNRPWDIDSALLRPGRLDYLIRVDLPNDECRKLMFKKNLNKISLDDEVLQFLIERTYNYNGADIGNVCDKLLRIVVSKEIEGIDKYNITIEDCNEVLKETKSSVLKADIEKFNKFSKSNM